MQLGITLITCAQGSYVLALSTLPMCIYNIHVYLRSPDVEARLVNKKYKVHALFRKDYRTGGSISTSSIVKCVFYGVMCILLFLK